MKRALAAALAAVALVAAGCGGGDTEELEARIAELQQQVAAQQERIDQLEQDTSSLRALEERVDGLLERLPDLSQLQDLLGRLGIG